MSKNTYFGPMSAFDPKIGKWQLFGDKRGVLTSNVVQNRLNMSPNQVQKMSFVGHQDAEFSPCQIWSSTGVLDIFAQKHRKEGVLLPTRGSIDDYGPQKLWRGGPKVGLTCGKI